VITDGAPERRKAVEQTIVEASFDLAHPADLKIVLVQVGADAAASQWLKGMKGRLQCKHDILETVTSDQLREMGVQFAD